MKSYLLIPIFLLSLLANAQTADEVVQDFFKALNDKDVEILDKLTLEDMHLHSLQLSDSIVVSSSTKIEFLENFKKIPESLKIEERIFDITSLQSKNLAQFQVPYEFYVNGELSHSGTNVLTLIKKEKQWFISYIADTRE